MSAISTPGGQRRARFGLQAINIKIIKAAALHRQAHGRGNGARLPAALGHRPVMVREITEGRPGPQARRITPLGYRTATRALPPTLPAWMPPTRAVRRPICWAPHLSASDRSRAAIWLAAILTREYLIGGVTARVKHATRLRMIETIANGWAVDRRHGTITRDPDLVLMPVVRKGRNRQDIRAYSALVMLCVEGLDLAAILRRHGWSEQAKHTKPLGLALLATLDDPGDALDFGQWHDKPGVDS
jgi:hypothetical protein